MNSISELKGKAIDIVQPSLMKKVFELKVDEKQIGTMRFTKFLSFHMTINIFKKEWEIYKPSFWKSTIAIKDLGNEIPFAKYVKTKFKNEGILFLPLGKQYKIPFRTNMQGFKIYSSSGKCLINFKEDLTQRRKTRVFIEQYFEILNEHPWLIVLPLYRSLVRKCVVKVTSC